jgi:arabinose-5-phosphate isomerase
LKSIKKNQKQKILNIKNSILNTAKKTIQIESKAIAHLEQLLDDDFANAVELIYKSKGRVNS